MPRACVEDPMGVVRELAFLKGTLQILWREIILARERKEKKKKKL